MSAVPGIKLYRVWWNACDDCESLGGAREDGYLCRCPTLRVQGLSIGAGGNISARRLHMSGWKWLHYEGDL